MEVAAVETTVEFSESFSVSSITPTSITVVIMEGTTGSANSADFSYQVTVNGDETVTVTGITNFETTFTFPSTTLTLSLPARQTAFIFSGAVATEITIPSEHTHVTVDGVETAVDLPGLTTTIEATDSTNVIVQLSEVTTEVVFTEETYAFTWQTYQISDDNSKSICGTYTLSTAAASSDDLCVPGISTVITLPTNAAQGQVFLHATGLTTAFTLPGITTTFARVGICLVKGGRKEASAFYIRPCLVCQKTILEEEL